VDTGEVRLRTEVIASEVIFLGGIQQSRVPMDYYLAEREEQLPEADRGDVPIDEREATLTDN
jgi:hypothetical protein